MSRTPSFLLVCLCAFALAAPAALARPVTPKHVVVAVIDSGVTPAAGFRSRMLRGWDFVDGDTDATDANGHGTEIASIIATQCAQCLIQPVRVIGAAGMGSVPLAIAGIQWALANGSDLINLSMTTPSDNPALAAALEAAVARGVTVVVAAGNQGRSVGYPAMSAPHAIAVGSVDPSGRSYSWSNYGPWVAVQAPGVLSATNDVGRSVTAVGTSASAAFVTGAAGRLLSCLPGLAPSAVRAQVQQALYTMPC